MLLQIMEEGRLTDSYGRHVDFKNTILIMTSNVGAHKITHQEEFGFQKRDENWTYERMKETLKDELENTFRPEFINRIDEIVVFHKLTHTELVQIVDLELAKLASRMRQKDLDLEVTREAKDYLIEHGTDEKFGARPLRRAIEHHLEDALSEAMLRGDFDGKNKVIASIKPPATDDDLPMLLLEGIVVEKEEAEPVAASHSDET